MRGASSRSSDSRKSTRCRTSPAHPSRPAAGWADLGTPSNVLHGTGVFVECRWNGGGECSAGMNVLGGGGGARDMYVTGV